MSANVFEENQRVIALVKQYIIEGKTIEINNCQVTVVSPDRIIISPKGQTYPQDSKGAYGH